MYKDYDKPEFEATMPSHFLPREILDWTRTEKMPPRALDLFLVRRAELIIQKLRGKLHDIEFSVIERVSGTIPCEG